MGEEVHGKLGLGLLVRTRDTADVERDTFQLWPSVGVQPGCQCQYLPRIWGLVRPAPSLQRACNEGLFSYLLLGPPSASCQAESGGNGQMEAVAPNPAQGARILTHSFP